jgi:hypothetical protein
MIVDNALNEVCNGIALKGEFSTRMGCSRKEADELLDRIQVLISSTQD